MDKFVIYDTETTNSTIWGSIIEVGAVVVDKNLNEIGKLNIRGITLFSKVPKSSSKPKFNSRGSSKPVKINAENIVGSSSSRTSPPVFDCQISSGPT